VGFVCVIGEFCGFCLCNGDCVVDYVGAGNVGEGGKKIGSEACSGGW
jgi:hypothetical protein